MLQGSLVISGVCCIAIAWMQVATDAARRFAHFGTGVPYLSDFSGSQCVVLLTVGFIAIHLATAKKAKG